jgi:hypothetical protein
MLLITASFSGRTQEVWLFWISLLSSVNSLLYICLRQEYRLVHCTCGCNLGDPTFADCYRGYLVSPIRLVAEGAGELGGTRPILSYEVISPSPCLAPAGG